MAWREYGTAVGWQVERSAPDLRTKNERREDWKESRYEEIEERERKVSRRLKRIRWMREKGSNGAEKSGVITEGKRLRGKSDVKETERKRCMERASGSAGGRMKLRWRNGDRWQ